VAKFITFNGTTLIHPGGLTKVDAAGMAQVGAGVSGVVGIIGEADYGTPYNIVTAAAAGEPPKVYEFTDPDAMAQTFKSGALADAVDFLFNPSNDIRIPGGVQKVIAIKSNRDTQSSGSVKDRNDLAANGYAAEFTSRGYGVSSNSTYVKIEANSVDNSTVDITITDAISTVVETFTQVGGNQLLDVQYSPSKETLVGVETSCTASPGVGSELESTGVPALVTAGAAVGQFVRVTSDHLSGQVRRISAIAGNTITVDSNFLVADGTVADAPVSGDKFVVLREFIGAFKAVAAGVSHVTIPGYFDVSGTPGLSLQSGVIGEYGDRTNGPCYIKVLSGPGAGQIRKISNASLDGLNHKVTIVGTWDVLPALGTVGFINAVTSSNVNGSQLGSGAVGRIRGASGVSTSLSLHVRPGYGEPTGSGTTVVGVGQAGSSAPAGLESLGLRTLPDWKITLSATKDVEELVQDINKNASSKSGVTKSSVATDSCWLATVGAGRSGATPTSVFDFGYDPEYNGSNDNNALSGGETSQGVDCLCGLNTTNYSGWLPVAATLLGTYSANPQRYHRFTDDLNQVITTVNNESTLVTAARKKAHATDGGGVPAFKSNHLSTGGTYTPTTADALSKCFDELIKHRHNTAVALWSEDWYYADTPVMLFTIDYVHSLLATHAKQGAGAYRNEVDCIAAYRPPTSSTDPTALVKDKATTLNDRNLALVFQDMKRPGLNGLVNAYPPHMLACAVAGMQSGATVGTPLTYKLVRANNIVCRNTYLDTLDKNTSNELLMNGCLFTEKVTGKGFRIVRNLSTYLSTDNLAYTDRHVNYELNFMSYDLRTFIEDKFVGEKSTPATAASIKSAVISKLDYYKNSLEIIVNSQDPITGKPQNAYKDLKITISGDICTIRFEIFPAVGINYLTFEIVATLPTISA
jgi:hypothetical protein